MTWEGSEPEREAGEDVERMYGHEGEISNCLFVKVYRVPEMVVVHEKEPSRVGLHHLRLRSRHRRCDGVDAGILVHTVAVRTVAVHAIA